MADRWPRTALPWWTGHQCRGSEVPLRSPTLVRVDTEPLNGRVSSACSLARSVLAVKQRPVVLVLDTDTTDEPVIREQKLIFQELLDYASPGLCFEVCMAVPETEILLVRDRQLVEKLAATRFSDTEWKQAERNPGKFLSDVLGGNGQCAEKIIGNWDQEAIRLMREHPLVKDIHRFLSSVIDDDQIYR